ncbi:hypothetical protein DRE_04929 [Drechslerella stenobrocha 248]|uniref:Uncharacterized protein n=1 Tax=Drechslerella stenobrocha 248 TaxID=1043628 RepID=W7I0B3_9PEZI|nr:hypothetical protein DRE_04929 [Drechslerella stenobrocha 248]
MSTTPPIQRRQLPASPLLSPRPSSTAHPAIGVFMRSKTPSRASASTPRPQSPQDSFFTAPSYGYPSPKSLSPTSPTTRPLSFSPYLRHLSPAPSSGVSSVRSMSEAESSDEEILSPLSQGVKVHIPDPESESELESEGLHNQDMELVDLADPTRIPLDLQSDITSMFSEKIFQSSMASHRRSATMTIEELPALPLSPALSRTTSSGSSISTPSLGHASHVSWQDSGIEIIQGEYSSCASSSDLDTTDDPQTEDDDLDDFEWNVDVCSSSYPTDDFLLGGLLGLSTTGTSNAGLGMNFGKGMAGSYANSNRPATPFSPRRTRGYSASATSLFTEDLDGQFGKNGTIKRRSLNVPNLKKRRRIYSLFDDEQEGDDESDDAESPSKRVKGRMTIDTVLNGSMRAKKSKGKPQGGGISQMFGETMAEDMDVDL